MNFIRVRHFSSSEMQLFESNIQYLFYVGLWPNENWPKMHRLLYKIYEVTLHILSIIFLLITAIGTFQKKDDVHLLLSNVEKTLVGYNYALKVAAFVSKRDQLKQLIEEIEVSGDVITEERKTLMRNFVLVVAGLTTTILSAFSGLALLKGEMTMEAWMPFDPMKNRMNLHLAALIIVISFLVPCLYRSAALQGLVCSLIMYVCDQLKDLQVRLRALEYSTEIDKATRKEFKAIVKKHIRLMRYSKSMSMAFKEFFLIQTLAVTLELCLNVMMVTVVGSHDITLLTSFLAMLALTLLNAYIFCHMGNEMIVQICPAVDVCRLIFKHMFYKSFWQSQGVALAAYESPWICWPLDLQKDLLTVIRMAQKPLQMSAGGITYMSIQTFAKALYNGYSMFAVLNDVVD